jgi:antitoxin (DNA-binding transcriptional repressor) of toxin-antitoxin stability system
MRVVGIRELKDRLSQYVKTAAAGEPVLVTDRGRVVAELRAFDPDRADELGAGLASLVASGSVLLPRAPHRPELYRRPRSRVAPGTAARLLDEERGER